MADLWHGAERVQSLHGYLPINITIGLEEHPFISYDTLGGIDSVLLKIHVFFFVIFVNIYHLASQAHRLSSRLYIKIAL